MKKKVVAMLVLTMLGVSACGKAQASGDDSTMVVSEEASLESVEKETNEQATQKSVQYNKDLDIPLYDASSVEAENPGDGIDTMLPEEPIEVATVPFESAEVTYSIVVEDKTYEGTISDCTFGEMTERFGVAFTDDELGLEYDADTTDSSDIASTEPIESVIVALHKDAGEAVIARDCSVNKIVFTGEYTDWKFNGVSFGATASDVETAFSLDAGTLEISDSGEFEFPYNGHTIVGTFEGDSLVSIGIRRGE